jgi:hypothetical protein
MDAWFKFWPEQKLGKEAKDVGLLLFFKSYHPIPWRDSISRPMTLGALRC